MHYDSVRHFRFMIGQYVTVHGDVISHVNISAVRVEEGGEYRCSAVNRVAKAHHSARLNIYGLPHVRPMGKYAAVAGETTVIKCPVAGYPIASITWDKGQWSVQETRREGGESLKLNQHGKRERVESEPKHEANPTHTYNHYSYYQSNLWRAANQTPFLHSSMTTNFMKQTTFFSPFRSAFLLYYWYDECTNSSQCVVYMTQCPNNDSTIYRSGFLVDCNMIILYVFHSKDSDNETPNFWDTHFELLLIKIRNLKFYYYWKIKLGTNYWW